MSKDKKVHFELIEIVKITLNLSGIPLILNQRVAKSINGITVRILSVPDLSVTSCIIEQDDIDSDGKF